MRNNLELLKEQIRGPVFSIITPFCRDESIDYQSLGNYVNYLYKGGARIFYVMAYNSRFSELTFDEIKDVNKYVVETAKSLSQDNIVIVADPIHCSTQISIEFATHAQKIGADIISLIFREKFYFEEQVFKHYEMVANNIDIGILIHEMPFISGMGGHTMDWPVSLLDRLADIENIIAIKEDAKNDDLTLKIVNKLKDRLTIITSGGGKRQWLNFVNHGCQAWLNGIGVFEPKLATYFYKYYLSDDNARYMDIINKIEIPFFEQTVSKFGWHLSIKSALEAYGVMSRYERMPMMPLPEEKHKIVGQVVNELPINDVLIES